MRNMLELLAGRGGEDGMVWYGMVWYVHIEEPATRTTDPPKAQIRGPRYISASKPPSSITALPRDYSPFRLGANFSSRSHHDGTMLGTCTDL